MFAFVKMLHTGPLKCVKNTHKTKAYCSTQSIKACSFQFPVCFYFYFCDLTATRVRGRGKGGNQIKIPLYYPAVGMPLAGIRARLRSSARCVLRGLPPVHKRNYSDRRAGDTKRPGVPVEGTEEDGTAPSGPASATKAKQEDGSFEEVHTPSHPTLAHDSSVGRKSVRCQRSCTKNAKQAPGCCDSRALRFGQMHAS